MAEPAFGDTPTRLTTLGRLPGDLRTDGRRTARRTVANRALPSGRAALGALLVTVSALGAFLIATRVGRGRGVTVLVARRDLAAGATLRPDDLATQTATLPPDLLGQVFTDQRQLRDVTLKGPLQRGEIFQPGNLIAGKKGGPDSRQVPLTIEAAAAAGGLLGPFDTVDVIATFGTGTAAITRMVATNLHVVYVSRAAERLGSATGKTTVVFAVDDPRQAIELVAANATGQVVLVRTTGAAAASADVLSKNVTNNPAEAVHVR